MSICDEERECRRKYNFHVIDLIEMKTERTKSIVYELCDDGSPYMVYVLWYIWLWERRTHSIILLVTHTRNQWIKLTVVSIYWSATLAFHRKFIWKILHFSSPFADGCMCMCESVYLFVLLFPHRRCYVYMYAFALVRFYLFPVSMCPGQAKVAISGGAIETTAYRLVTHTHLRHVK